MVFPFVISFKFITAIKYERIMDSVCRSKKKENRLSSLNEKLVFEPGLSS